MALPALTSYSAATGQPINGGRWAGGRLTGDVALSAVAPAGTLGLNPSDLSGDVALSAVAPAGGMQSLTLSTISVADGTWTWYNDPRAIVDSDGLTTYVGYNSGGDMMVAKIDHATLAVTEGTVNAGFNTDDHSVPALVQRSDGVLMAWYSRIGDTVPRYRVAGAARSVASWGATQWPTVPSYLVTYTNPRYLPTTDKLLIFARGHVDSDTRVHMYCATSNWGTSWGPWVEFLKPPSGQTGRPYLVMRQDGDRLHLLISTRSPAQAGACSTYHLYAEWHEGDGALRYYGTDGTRITAALPFAPSDATLIYDGTTVKGWNWDIAVDADGNPHALFMKYVTSGEIRMFTSRWNGSAWTTPVDIIGGNVGDALIPTDSFYTGGAWFDSADPDALYLSRKVSGVWELAKFRTTDSGATWTKVLDLTTGTTSPIKNFRPFVPAGRVDGLAVFWPQGTYDDYYTHSCTIKAANAAG